MEKPRNNVEFFKQKEHFDKSNCLLQGTYPDTPNENAVVLPFSYMSEPPLCYLSNLARVEQGVVMNGKMYSSVEHAIVSTLFNNKDIFDHGSRFNFRDFYHLFFRFGDTTDRGVNAFMRALDKSAVGVNNMVGFLPMMVSKYTDASVKGHEIVLKKLQLVRGGSVNDVDMLRMLRSKFNDPFMRAVLLSTRDAYLVCEGPANGFFTAKYTRSKVDPLWAESVKKDEKAYGYKETDVRFPNFSFQGKTVGTNALGKYLMLIRHEIYRELKLYTQVSPLDKMSLRLALTTFLLATGQQLVEGKMEVAQQTKSEAQLDETVDGILARHDVESSNETIVLLKSLMPSIMNVYTKLAHCYAHFSVSRGWVLSRIRNKEKFRVGVHNLLVTLNRRKTHSAMLNENLDFYFEKQAFFDVVLQSKFGALNGLAKVATMTSEEIGFQNFETKEQLREALSAFYRDRGEVQTPKQLDDLVKTTFDHQYLLEERLVKKFGEGLHTSSPVHVPRTTITHVRHKTLPKTLRRSKRTLRRATYSKSKKRVCWSRRTPVGSKRRLG